MHISKTSRTRQYLVGAVYVETYNERIKDLLNPHAVDIAAREDKAGCIFVGAKETVVACFENAIVLLRKGRQHDTWMKLKLMLAFSEVIPPLLYTSSRRMSIDWMSHF